MSATLRKGIIASGNWIIDIVKILDVYPQQESLANILSESISNGGSPYNLLKDLSKLKASFPIEAIGLVGNDERGKYILKDCQEHGIDTQQLTTTSLAPTSYTDVMSVASDGKRTFFHQRGANALLNHEHFNLKSSNAKIFHLGYLMLLDKLDELNNGKTAASELFKSAKELGFITSTDMVSENSNRFKEVVSPSLPYIDILFINEFEAEKITSITTTKGGKIDLSQCIEASKVLLKMGVKKWVILHFPEGAIALNPKGDLITQGSVHIASENIASAVGAGDAFAAGVLFGIHEEFPIQQCLKLGVGAAATSLYKPNCSDGVLSADECFAIGNHNGYKSIGN